MWVVCFTGIHQPQPMAESAALVIDLYQKFLAWQKQHGSETTYGFYSRHKIRLRRSWALEAVPHVRPYHVQEWLDAKYPTASQTYRYNLIRAVKRPFLWAKKLGYILVDPLESVSRGSQTSRQHYLEPRSGTPCCGWSNPARSETS